MQALISALAAGLVAVLVTVAIEKLGGRRGGLLGTIPTTIVPASIGFWWVAAGVPDFRKALFVVPAGMMLNALFLWLWRELPERLPAWSLGARLVTMVFVSFIAWSILAVLVLLATDAYRSAGFPMVLWGLAFFVLAVLLGIAACVRKRPSPAGTRRVGALVLMGRGLLAALAIGLAVVIASVSSPIIAGMVSVFPAIFFTTMIALWISQGEAVPSGAVGPMMLGSTSVSAYALLAALIIPLAGPGAGALLAWVGSVLFVTIPAWFLLHALADKDPHRITTPASPKTPSRMASAGQ